MNKLSLSQIDDALATAKMKYLRDSIDKLRQGGASEDTILLYRHTAETTLVAFNIYILAEVRDMIGKAGGDA